MDIEKALKKLLVKSPFYGLFCLSLSKRLTNNPREMKTLGVARKGLNCELLINTDFWEENTDEQQIALLQHELSHICLQHMFIDSAFPDKELFNIAADLECNSYIENLPPGGCFPKDFGLTPGQGSKFYYETLSQPQTQQRCRAQSPQQPCNGGQGGQNQQQQEEQDGNQTGQGEPKHDTKYPDFIPDGKGPIDSHGSWKDFQNAPDATQQLIKNNINSIIKSTAEQVEKMRGTIPGELTEIVEKLREKKPEIFNWKAYFRRMLGSIYDVNIKSTRRKESKRFEGNAGVQHKKKVSILVAVDTSGSVSSNELQDFFSEIQYVYKAGARVTILECDTRINKIVEYDGKRIPEVVGRGGKMKVCASLRSNA